MKFVRLSREYGTDLNIANRLVHRVDNKEHLGVGGYPCKIKDPIGNVFENSHLSIVMSEGDIDDPTKEHIVIIQKDMGDAEHLSDEDLLEYYFDLTNKDF